jgi:hypothetical protein
MSNDPTVTVDYDYAEVNTKEWFAAVAEDVTEYWQAIVNRCAKYDDTDTRNFYSSSSVETHNKREARDRVIAALRERAANTGYYSPSNISGHTYNHDTNFGLNFGYEAVELYRGDMSYGYLIFLSYGEHFDYGLDAVFLVDTEDEVWNTLSPRIGYYCDQDGHNDPYGYGENFEMAESTNGGYSFDTSHGDELRDIIKDGQATCSLGHPVILSVETNW